MNQTHNLSHNKDTFNKSNYHLIILINSSTFKIFKINPSLSLYIFLFPTCKSLISKSSRSNYFELLRENPHFIINPPKKNINIKKQLYTER